MPTEKLSFQGHSGDTLAARYDTPEGKTKATAIFAHCFSCSKDINAAKRIASRLTDQGIAVLRFDFTGLGHSEGEFENTHFSSNVDDLVAAAKFLDANYSAPSLLIGHSLGGAAVLAAAGEISSVKAVATIGAPAEPEHVQKQFGASIAEIEAEGEAEVKLGGRPFKIKREFLDDIRENKLAPKIKALDAAVLVLHSPVDNVVKIENAHKIFTAATHPRSFVTLDDADHLITKARDAEYAADVIAAWSRRYLDIAPDPAPAKSPEGIVRVAETGTGRFTQDVTVEHHHILADEPKSFGGDNLGLTPYQLVSAGLGACTSMTVRGYARRKNLPLEFVSVDVTHNKIHAEDCADCETKTGKIDKWERVITVKGNLDEKMRKDLLRIADLCPVHKTLEGEVHIETRLDEM